MRRPVDLPAVLASRRRLEALFRDNPNLRVPSLADLENALTTYLYTPEQIAFIAQVTPQTARRWLREGVLEGGRLPADGPQRWRVTDEQARRFFEASGIPVPELPAPEEVDRRRRLAKGGE